MLKKLTLKVWVLPKLRNFLAKGPIEEQKLDFVQISNLNRSAILLLSFIYLFISICFGALAKLYCQNIPTPDLSAHIFH